VKKAFDTLAGAGDACREGDSEKACALLDKARAPPLAQARRFF
jgi:hypothetical protein